MVDVKLWTLGINSAGKEILSPRYARRVAETIWPESVKAVEIVFGKS